jgi:hypothetical protein
MDTHVAGSVGKYSGFAFLYLSGCLITAVLNSVFVADYRLLLPNILYTLRRNQLVSNNKWINVNYLAYFIHLFIYIMNGLVYAMILTIAILTGDGWKGSSLFFIGVVIFNVLNIFFMLYYNSWQPTICFPYYKTFIILGVLAFIIAQLTGLPGTPTYRAHGALYVALSAIPLLLVYTHHFDDTKKANSSVESSLSLEKQRIGTKGSMDNLYALLKDPHVLIPRQNLSLWMADQLYAKLVSLQKSILGIPNPDGTLSLFFRNNFKVSIDFVVSWLVSYIPLVIFCSVMTRSIDSNASAAAIVLVVLFLNDLCLFSLRLKWSHLCCILVTYRFIAVLAGSYYWLLGIFVITLFTITVRALEILDSYVFKSKLSSNTISSILTSLTAKEKESIEHQKVVAAHLADDSTATRTPSPVADASIPPVKSGHITAITSYISLPIVTLHCILIVALIIAATTPNNLLVPRFSSATETEWAGLLWLAWATAMVMYCTHKIKNLPVNKDGSISIVERLEAALESQKGFKVVGTALANIDLDVKVTLNSSTGVPTADSNVVADAAAGTAMGNSRSASAPDLGNHYTLLTAYLKLLSCLMLVATSVMAACIQRLWVIIPTITIIPISVFIWMKFMAKWGKDDNSFDKCLPFVSPCYNCAQSTWERPTFSSLGANMLSNPLFALVLLIVTCAICARMHYWYCVLYLCLWILAAALIHMAAMYWFSNVKLDYILLAIISASFIPTVIWALVAGLTQSSGIDKYGVIMLMMSATVFQLLVIIVVIYRDYLQMKASADAANNAKAKSFLYGLISLAFTCAVICASIFSVQVSAPLGIGFICLIVAVALYFHLQLSENNKTILSDVKAYLESVAARCGACISSNCPVIQRASQGAGGALSRLLPLSSDKYTNYLTITGLFVTLCGLYGAIADSDNAFWWSSLSWLSMSTVFLLLGLQVEMLQYYDKIDRVYDTDVFVPVHCFDSSSNGKVSNVSFRSCGLVIFLAMLAAWGIWVSVIALPPDIGVVIYTISAVATLVYIKFGCGKTTLCINQLVATGAFTDELLLDCGNTSIKAFSGTTALLDPSNAAKEASDPAAVYTAIVEYAVQKQTALELLNKEVTAQCVSYLSPVPLVGALLAWQSGVVFDKLANEAAVNAMHELYETFTDDFALLTEFYAYFRLTALSAARLHYRQHIAGLLAFIQSNSTLAVREKDLLNLNEVEMLAIMSGYNRYLKSKEAESEVSKKEEERIKEQQRRIEEERRRVLEAEELTKRRQAEEEERKRCEAEEAIRIAREKEEQRRIEEERRRVLEEERKRIEEATRIAREKEEQRKRDELAAKGVQDEQYKLEEERKRVEEATRIAREKEEQRRIEEERRRVQDEQRKLEEERKRVEEAIRIAREKEEQRKRDELAAKRVQDEQRKLEEERKRVEEAKQREIEEQRKKHVRGDDDDVVVSTYGRPVQESVDAIFGKMANAATKYVDPDFSSTTVVLGDAKYTGKAKKDMKRLTELNSGMLREISPVGLPQAGVSSQDIKQGALGDCYFLSAIATVASKPKLIENIFPAALPDKGIYTVKLYHEGGFKTVVVDDYFPVDTNESLMFAHPDEWATKKLANSAWVMILEKGYAKLNGNYANIGEGGYEDVAMGVLTGGIPDRISDINKASDGQKTWETLKSLYNNGHLLGAGSHAGSDTTTSDLGIVQGHAYSILQVREVDEFKLMQLRNPWVSPTTSSFTHSFHPLTSLLTRATANGVVSGLTKILKVGQRESSRL